MIVLFSVRRNWPDHRHLPPTDHARDRATLSPRDHRTLADSWDAHRERQRVLCPGTFHRNCRRERWSDDGRGRRWVNALSDFRGLPQRVQEPKEQGRRGSWRAPGLLRRRHLQPPLALGQHSVETDQNRQQRRFPERNGRAVLRHAGGQPAENNRGRTGNTAQFSWYMKMMKMASRR